MSKSIIIGIYASFFALQLLVVFAAFVEKQRNRRERLEEGKVVLRCPRPNGLFPYSEDCGKFLNCAHGRPYLQSCGPGTLFNPHFSICDYPRNVRCQHEYPYASSSQHHDQKTYVVGHRNPGQIHGQMGSHKHSHGQRHDQQVTQGYGQKDIHGNRTMDGKDRNLGHDVEGNRTNTQRQRDNYKKGQLANLGNGTEKPRPEQKDLYRNPAIEHRREIINPLFGSPSSDSQNEPGNNATQEIGYGIEPLLTVQNDITEKPTFLKKIHKIKNQMKTKLKSWFSKFQEQLKDNMDKSDKRLKKIKETFDKMKHKANETLLKMKNLVKLDSWPQDHCIKENGVFPYQKDCSKFVNCWRGFGTLQGCPPGTLFDPSLSVCNWPSQVVCISHAILPQVASVNEVNEVTKPKSPFAGQFVRLKGGGAPYMGYLEVWSDHWKPVVIVEEKWNHKDEVCVNLGFTRGAHSETRGLIYGGKEEWKEMPKSAFCEAKTKNLTECVMKPVKRSTLESSIVGLRCKKNFVSECPGVGWLRWGTKCYYVPHSPKISHRQAKQECEDKEARLLSIVSQTENDFISDLLLSTRKTPQAGFHTGGISFDLMGEKYWIWEGTKMPHSRQLAFEKWWPGWVNSEESPEVQSNRTISKKSNYEPRCLVLQSDFPFANGSRTYSAHYYFWKLVDCEEKRYFVCEKDPYDVGCIIGRGESYNGTANITTSGAACMDWNDLKGSFGRSLTKMVVLGNYCFNPDGDDLPWCFVRGGTSEFCDIPRCENTKPVRMTSLETTVCQPGFFSCSNATCIHLEWACDGTIDCPHGDDEEDCPNFNGHFKKLPGMRMVGSEMEKWLFSPKSTCASRCAQTKKFICYSFNYEEASSTCILNKNNLATAGGLTEDPKWEFHERKDLAVNCMEKFVCSDFKCLKPEEVCDGRRDCRDGEDENECIDLESLRVRLVNGSASHEGRVEINVGDDWGQICDDMLDLQDGHVICRQLGYPMGAKHIFTNSRFGDGSGYFIMDDLNCAGNEESLAQCDFGGWYHSDCHNSEAASVQCYRNAFECSSWQWQCKNGRCIDFPYYCDTVNDCGDNSDEDQTLCSWPVAVRIVKHEVEDEQKKPSRGRSRGKSGERSSRSEVGSGGRVEIRYKGIWGTICDDDIDLKEGHVLCRMLGWRGAASVDKNNTFGAGNGPIWLDGLKCIGQESTIMECQHQRWGITNCEHLEDLGIVCTNNLPLNEEIIPSETQPNSIVRPANLFPAKCGVRNVEDNPKELLASPRIVSGHIPRPGANPWIVGIRRKIPSGSIHECGGFILTEDLILTAAHCVVKYRMSDYLIRTGDFNNEETDVYEKEWSAESAIVHPLFDKETLFNNDISILKIKRKRGRGIRFNERVQPLCLIEANWNYLPGLACTVAGWGTLDPTSGYSLLLQSTLLPILPDSSCRAEDVYGATRISPGMFCAGYMEGGIDTCQGDSGGPLVCLVKGRYTAVGITSWGHGCARANKPGVYTKLTEYLNWIYNMSEAVNQVQN